MEKRLGERLGDVGAWTKEFLFPRCCPVCGEIVMPRGALICPGCLAQLKPVHAPFCMKCGRELIERQGEYCPACLKKPRSFDSGAALLNYNDAAQWSLAQVKYRNRREYLDFYAEAMNLRFQKRVRAWGCAVMVPVPVHSSRLRTRGFNQAQELAKRLSCMWRIPVETKLLYRRRPTAPQRDLDPAQRLKNLQSAFAVSERAEIPESVLLIDDIYTTGSTMEACARVLRAAGVRRIHFLVIAVSCAE